MTSWSGTAFIASKSSMCSASSLSGALRPAGPPRLRSIEDDLLRLAAADRVAEPMAHQAEVVVHLGLELELLQRRDLGRRATAGSS